MNWFKILGLLLILLSTTSFGFYKANRLVKRSRALGEICVSLEKLAELIKCGTGELKELLSLSFSDKIGNGNEIMIDDSLLKEDNELLKKLISEMGISHRETEYKHILLYKTLFEKRLREAENDSTRLCKLYNTLGFLTGLSICIFLV